MNIEEFANQLGGDDGKYVRGVYQAIQYWESEWKKQNIPFKGVPKIHIIQGVREIVGWEGYKDFDRLKVMDSALSRLVESQLVTVIADNSGKDNDKYRITRTT